MKSRFIVLLVFVAILGFAYFQKNFSYDSREQINTYETSNAVSEKINCVVCSKDLTNDYNRIAPNGNRYFCLPCYKQTMREVNKNVASENYNSSDYSENESQSNSGYSVDPNGRVYENEACTLCGGTGVETSRSATFGNQSRTCPKCDGRGHQSY